MFWDTQPVEVTQQVATVKYGRI